MKRIVAMTLVSGAVASFGAAADGLVVPMDAYVDGDKYQIVVDKSRRAVRQLGAPQTHAERERTAGKTDGIPLRTALFLLLPEGWHSVATQDVDLDATVGWSENVGWLDALEEVGLTVGAQFVVDWGERRVGVRHFADRTLIKWGPEGVSQ